MFRVLVVFSALISMVVLADSESAVNMTAIDLCDKQYSNCNSRALSYNVSNVPLFNVLQSDCKAALYRCSKEGGVDFKRPSSCYQADQAWVAVKTGIIVTVSVVFGTIFISNLRANVQSLKALCRRCGFNTKDTEVQESGAAPGFGTQTDEDEGYPPLQILSHPSGAEEKREIKKISHTITTAGDALKDIGVSWFGSLVGMVPTAVSSYVGLSWTYSLWQAYQVANANCLSDSNISPAVPTP